MTHLRDTEFVDLLDGPLPPSRAAHLAACDACRATADQMRATARISAATPAEEPSPLFWEHFARSVNQRIDEPPVASHGSTGLRLAFGTLAVFVVGLLVVTMFSSRVVRAPFHVAPPVASTTPPLGAPDDDLDADVDWAVVRAAADDLDLDGAQAAGLATRPGTADRVAMELTAAERAELIRLLNTEFKTGA